VCWCAISVAGGQSAEGLEPTVVLQAECIIKIIGFGWKEYWGTSWATGGWNRFDLLIASIMSIDFFTFLTSGSSISALAFLRVQKLLRLLRLSRMVKAFKFMQGLMHLVQAVVKSMGAICQVGALIFLVVFMYAYMGVLLFGQIARGCVLCWICP
jgi:hypothetical protein